CTASRCCSNRHCVHSWVETCSSFGLVFLRLSAPVFRAQNPRVASGGTVSRRFFFVLGFVLATGALLLTHVFRMRLQAATEWDRQVQLAVADARRVHDQTIVPTEDRVHAGQNFTVALQKFGLSPEEAADASAAAQQAFNLRQVRAGNTITVNRSLEGTL